MENIEVFNHSLHIKLYKYKLYSFLSYLGVWGGVKAEIKQLLVYYYIILLLLVKPL